MKKFIFIFFITFITPFYFFSNGCLFEKILTPEDSTKIKLTFNSDSILYRGKYFKNQVIVDTNALVGIVKDGKVFLYYSGFGTKYQNNLNDSLSALSLIHCCAKILRNRNEIIQSPITTISGVDITGLGNKNYQFSNTLK
jgi:hypothetical protein